MLAAFGLAGSAFADSVWSPAPPPQAAALEDGRPLVPVRVGKGSGNGSENGRPDADSPFAFIVDSAASHSVIYDTLVSRLGLESVPGASIPVTTAAGRRLRPVYDVGSLSAFGVTLPIGRTVALSDRTRGAAHGLIGVDLLRGRMLVLAGGAPRLIMGGEAPASDGEAGPWQAVQGRPVGRGSIAVDMRIDLPDGGRRTVPAILDTGASHTILTPAAARGLARHQGRDVRVESDGLPVPGRPVQVPGLALGGLHVAGVPAIAADLPVFRRFGVGADTSAALIGMDLLSRVDVALDFRQWRLWWRPPKESADPGGS